MEIARITKYRLEQMTVGESKTHRCRVGERDRMIVSLKVLARKQLTKFGKVFTIAPSKIGVLIKRES